MKEKNGLPGAALSIVTLSIGYLYWGWRSAIAATLALLAGVAGTVAVAVGLAGPSGALYLQNLPVIVVMVMALYHLILAQKSTVLLDTAEEARKASGHQGKASPALDAQVQKAYGRRLALVVFSDLLLCFVGIFAVVLAAALAMAAFPAGQALLGAVWLVALVAAAAALLWASRLVTERLRTAFLAQLRGLYGAQGNGQSPQ